MRQGPLDAYLLCAMHTLVEQGNDVLFFKDQDLDYVLVSPSFLELVGRPGIDVTGLTDLDFFPREMAEKYIRDDRVVLRERRPMVGEIEPIPGPKGKLRYGCTSKYPLIDQQGEIIGLYGVCRDVTDQVELEQEKERGHVSALLFEAVIEGDLAQDRIIRGEGVLLGAPIVLPLDLSYHAMVSHMARLCIHPDHEKDFLARFDSGELVGLYQAGTRQFTYTVPACRPGTRDYHWISLQSRLYESKFSGTPRIATFLKDVDDDMRRQEQLRQSASTDFLTGLCNRRSFFERVETILHQGEQQGIHALLFIDLDSFKDINDAYGHPTGDEILRLTAQQLKREFREQDLVARVGGDEFLVLMRSIASEEQAVERVRQVMARLRHFWQEHRLVGGLVTYSVGVSFCREAGQSFDQIYGEADQAMYKAKRAGRDQIAIF